MSEEDDSKETTEGARRVVVLKPADWEAAGERVCRRLIAGESNLNTPWVVLADDLGSKLGYPPRSEDEEEDARELEEAIASLAELDVKRSDSDSGIEVIAGEYAAEKILDRDFMMTLHDQLDCELLCAAVPERGVLIVTSGVDLEKVGRVWEKVQEFAPDAESPVTRQLFGVIDGVPASLIEPIIEPVGPRLPTWAAWILPVLLAIGAVGMHWWLNVPAQPVVENPRDQGAKKSAAQKRKERAERRRQKRMHQPRGGAELDTLLERYDGSDFEKEPVVGKWARQTQTMLNKAIVMSRKAAFEGAPEEPRVSVVRTQCRTIRCQMLLRSPYDHEVQLLADTLRRLETLTGESIWVRFEVEPGAAPDGRKDEEEDSDIYLLVTVALIADGIESDELIIGDEPEGDDAPQHEDEGKAPAKSGKPKGRKPKGD